MQHVHGYFDFCIVHTKFTRKDLRGKSMPTMLLSLCNVRSLKVSLLNSRGRGRDLLDE